MRFAYFVGKIVGKTSLRDIVYLSCTGATLTFVNSKLKTLFTVTEEIVYNGTTADAYTEGFYTIGTIAGYKPLATIGWSSSLSAMPTYALKLVDFAKIFYGFALPAGAPAQLKVTVLWIKTI